VVTVRPDRKGVPCDFGPKQLKLKRGDIRVRTRGGLTALVWKDRREVYMLTNMDPPPAEGNFCDDSNCPVKPHMPLYNISGSNGQGSGNSTLQHVCYCNDAKKLGLEKMLMGCYKT